MKKVLLFLILLISINSFPQGKDKQLISNETWYSASGEKNFRIITSNEKVIKEIFTRKEEKLSRVSISYKKDRMGRYKEVSFYFSLEDKDEILTFISGLK